MRNENSTGSLDFRLPDIRIETPSPRDTRRACFRARKVLEEIVYDTVALEGNPFTFPEVQTLMDGITVGGHRLQDADQVLNQAESWKLLFDEIENGRFVPLHQGLESALRLHAVVSRNEALEWGCLRGGPVGIAGTTHEPPPAEELEARWKRGAEALRDVSDPHVRAMGAFLFTARSQLFWDGNKRTGRLMMNGELLSAGYDAITVPAKKRHEFNTRMVRFYDTADAEEMVDFLAGCSLDRGLARVPGRRQSSGRRNPAGEGDAEEPPESVGRKQQLATTPLLPPSEHGDTGAARPSTAASEQPQHDGSPAHTRS